MSNKNNETKTSKAPDTAVTPVTGAYEALKAENESLKAELEALKAQAEKAAAAKVKLEAPNVPDNERVEIYVPKGNANDEHNLLISVNGVNYLLPKGKTSKAPKFIAEEFKRSQRAVETQDKHVDKMLAEASK